MTIWYNVKFSEIFLNNTVMCYTQDIDHLLNFVYLYTEHIPCAKHKSEVHSTCAMEPTVMAKVQSEYRIGVPHFPRAWDTRKHVLHKGLESE